MPRRKLTSPKVSPVVSDITEAPNIAPEEKGGIKKSLLIPIVLIILAGLLFYFKSLFIVATVNGQPIWRYNLIRDLEKQSGKRALDAIVTKDLVLQEAKKQNVVASDDEINKEIDKLKENLKKENQDLNQLLASEGMSEPEFREQMMLQKIVEKIAGKDIKVTDQEISDYISKNKDMFPKDSKPEDLKVQVKDQLTQQKLSEKIQEWITSLRNGAKINYYLQF